MKRAASAESLRVMSSRSHVNADVEAGEGQRNGNAWNGVDVAFYEVSYAVIDRAAPRRQEKMILQDVTGIFHPGEMTALMGPSGCGKTTLLDVLSGRKNVGRIEGDVRYNGIKPTPALLKRRCGYVEQFDTLVPNLTVFEMLLYTAHLTRPSTEPSEEKLQRVEAVITALRLEEARNTVIGDPLTKGISGGQAKRVNIGLALISQPDVLYLDEPTTGLDSFMANEVVSILRELCTAMSLTICATVHSPTAYSFNQFDSLLLLIKGRVAFNGNIGQNGENAKHFFETQGFHYPKLISYSVVEWLVDVVSGGYELTSKIFEDEDGEAGKGDASDNAVGRVGGRNTKNRKLLTGAHASITAEPESVYEDNSHENDDTSHGNGATDTEIGNNDDDGDNDADQFTTYYENSEDYKRIHDEVYAIIKSNVSTTDTEKQNLVSAIASRMNSGTTVDGLYALRTLVWFRGLKDLKDPTYIAPRLGDKVIFGFIVMSLFWGVGNDFYGNGIQSTVSVLFMICALNGFGAASYVPTLVLQRPLFYRERNDGLYGEATYLTFIFGMEAVLATVTCSVYTVIVYWAIHFHINFALLWVVYYVSALIGISAAFFFAAVSPNLQIANALLPIYMVRPTLSTNDAIHAERTRRSCTCIYVYVHACDRKREGQTEWWW